MSFGYVLGKMLSLALMMLLGFAANRTHILDGHSNKALSELVVNFTTPCMMLASLSATDAGRKDLLLMVVLGTALYAVMMVVAELVTGHLPLEENEIPVYKYFTVFTNNGFMGFPVVLALWGKKALLYASLMNIPISILIYSYGMYIYAKSAGKASRFELKTIINLPNVSAVLVLILALCSFKFTGFLQDTLEIVGDATVPMSMIVCGSTLAEKPLSGLFEKKFLYVFALIRLIAVPAIVAGLAWFLPVSPLVKGVLVVIAAMPGSANSVLFAQQYGVSRTLSSRYVFVSTVLSVLTIPLIAVFVLSRFGI